MLRTRHQTRNTPTLQEYAATVTHENTKLVGLCLNSKVPDYKRSRSIGHMELRKYQLGKSVRQM